MWALLTDTDNTVLSITGSETLRTFIDVSGGRTFTNEDWKLTRVTLVHKKELEALGDDTARLHKLIELNVINSAENVCHSTIVQNAWQNGQKLTVHAWAYDIETG